MIVIQTTVRVDCVPVIGVLDTALQDFTVGLQAGADLVK
jgi:hypothetical protein